MRKKIPKLLRLHFIGKWQPAYYTFSLSLIILVILSIIFLKRFNSLLKYSDSVEHTYKVIGKLNDFEGYMKDAETSQQGYLLTRDSAFLEPYEEVKDKIKATLDTVSYLTMDNIAQQKRLSYLRYAAGKRVIGLGFKELNNIYGDSVLIEQNLHDGKLVTDTIRSVMKNIIDTERTMLEERDSIKKFYLATVPTMIAGILIAAVVILSISLIVIIRQTQRRLAYQKELEIKNISLNAYTEELEQIAKITSHDLQEPLRKIRTFSSHMLIKQSSFEEGSDKNILERINNAATHMQGLVEGLRNYIFLSGSGEPMQPIDLNYIIQKQFSKLKPDYPDKDIVLRIGYIPPVSGYKKQLAIAFEELLENAIKFSIPNSQVSIQVTSQSVTAQDMKDLWLLNTAHGEYLEVVVEDNGIGFNEEFAGKIFIIFQRLYSGEEYKGKGVGLAIVKKVMSNHRGFVRASSTINKGSKFYLYFPLPE